MKYICILLFLRLALSDDDPSVCIFSRKNNQTGECENEEINKTLEVTWEHYYKNTRSNKSHLIREKVCLVTNSSITTTINNTSHPKCDTSFDKFSKNKICPDDLTEIPANSKIKTLLLCVKISESPVEWSDRLCQGSDATVPELSYRERDAIYEYLSSVEHVPTFWLPAHIPDGNRFNPLEWTLPGRCYGDVFKNFNVNETTNKSCVIAKVTKNFDLEMSNCKEKHYAVCVFKHQNFAIRSACPRNFGALSYKPNICYGIIENSEQNLNFNNYLKNRNAIRTIAKLFSHEKDEYFQMTKLKLNNDNINYYLVMNVQETIKVTVANEKRRFLSRIILEEKVVEMFLKFSAELDTLVLTVYNRNFIWRIDDENSGINCYSSPQSGVQLVSFGDIIWESPDQWKTMFKVNVNEDGPTYIQCMAHTVFNFTKVQSEGIVLTKKRNGHTFAMFFDLPYSFEQGQKVREDFGKEVALILDRLKNTPTEIEKYKLLQIHSVRVAKVESVEEDLSRITVLCHVTASLNYTPVDDIEKTSNKDEEENDWENRIKLRNLLSDLIKLYNRSRSSVNSTEFCFQEDLPDSPHNYWLPAVIGQNSTTKDLCLQSNGLPVTRRCVGSFIYGAMWEVTDNMTTICTQTAHSEVTSQLYEIDHSQRASTNPEKTMKDVKDVIDRNVKTIIPADVFYLSKILQNVANKNLPLKLATNTTPDKMEEIANDVISSYSSLMEVSENVMKLSARLNTTNVLLDALEKVVDETMAFQLEPSLNTTKSIDENNSHKSSDMINHPVDGVRVLVTPNLVVFSIDPRVANVTGLALYKIDSSSRNTVQRRIFEDNVYKFLYSNQSTEELLKSRELQSATFVPSTLLKRLNKINDTLLASLSRPIIVIKIFSNDVLFQEDRNMSANKVDGKIVSISIPGHNHDLPELLPLIMRFTGDANGAEPTCRYWNYKTWAKDGLVFQEKSSKDNNLILCGSSHLTQFAHLIVTSSTNTTVVTTLDPITAFGCMMALMGVIGIFITAASFKKWRTTTSSKVLIQFSAAIGMQMILYSFANTGNYSLHLGESYTFAECVALGTCLQYSFLVQFCFMMIIAYLQYSRYFLVFGKSIPKRFAIKSTFIGWGLPLVPVTFIVGFDRQSYVPLTSSDSTICYPTGLSFYLGVLLPAALVLLGNLILIAFGVINIPLLSSGTLNHSEAKKALSKIKMSIWLFFLLVLTWTLGLLTATKTGLFFSYLFFFAATLQGFVLLVYFIVSDPVPERVRESTTKESISLTTTDYSMNVFE